MDFFLGFLGILQITTLPGLLVYKLFRLPSNFVDKALIIFGTSLVSNYCVVFLLSLLGIYTRITLSVLLLGESLAIFWLYRNALNISMKNILGRVQGYIHEIIRFFLPKTETTTVSVLHYFLGVLLILLSARGILWGVSLLRQNMGTVFSVWDAVVSWNSWAMTWADGRIPQGTNFYPQLIPANWSITYVLLGSSTLQFFAKGIMPLFTIMMLVGFFNLATQTRRYSFLISLIILQPLLKNFINSGLSSGYVDIAVAFFVFGAIYALIKAQETAETDQRIQLYIIGALLSAGAAVTKQTGVYIALCYPVLVLGNMLSEKISLETKQLRKLILLFAVISMIWISWYTIKETQILMGTERSGIDTYVSLTANAYEGTNIFQQIVYAIGGHFELAILFILTFLVFPWMNRFYKTMTVLFAPYPFLWGWMAAYDTRNLAIFLPVLALIAGYSIDLIFRKLMEFSERAKILRTPLYVPVVLAFLALFGMNFIFSPQRLERRQVDLQKQIFSPAKNQMLYDLVAENGPQTRILTNYPMKYLPGLEEYQVRFDFEDYDLFLSRVKNPEVEYMLIPNKVNQRVKEYIDAKIASGDYQVISKDKQWKVFTLIKILNKE